MKNKIITYSFFALIIFATVFAPSCRSHKQSANSYGNNAPPASAQDFLKQGNKLINKKKYQDALDVLNKAIEADPAYGEALAFRGMTKYHLQDYKGAIADYDAALKLIPNFGEVYDLRGIAKAELGDKTGACEDWNKAFDMGFNKAYKLIDKFCLDKDTKK